MVNWFYEPAFQGVCDVEQNFKTYWKLIVNKVASLFVWKNLPDTIDERFIELNLIMGGKLVWFKDNDNIYCLNGNIGGEPNVYYEPCDFIVANPILGSKQLKIRNKDGSRDVKELDGILMANSDWDYESDSAKGGLSGLIYQTAALLADNISSINISQINSRLSILFSADSESIARTAEYTLKEIYSGKPYKVVEQDIAEKIQVNPVAATGQNNTIMSLIEAHQYILAQFFQEIGVSANYNMKRERLNTAEVEMNNGALDINIFNMLKNRQEAVALVNEKWGTEIEVDLNWAVFNEESGNATNEGKGEEPTPEEEAVGAGVAEANDDDLQIEGIKEDTIEQDLTEDNEDKENETQLEEAIESNLSDNNEGDSE